MYSYLRSGEISSSSWYSSSDIGLPVQSVSSKERLCRENIAILFSSLLSKRLISRCQYSIFFLVLSLLFFRLYGTIVTTKVVTTYFRGDAHELEAHHQQ